MRRAAALALLITSALGANRSIWFDPTDDSGCWFSGPLEGVQGVVCYGPGGSPDGRCGSSAQLPLASVTACSAPGGLCWCCKELRQLPGDGPAAYFCHVTAGDGTSRASPAIEPSKDLRAMELSIQQGEEMRACPAAFAGTEHEPLPEGWKAYPDRRGEIWFHCGFRLLLEDKPCLPGSRCNECAYDSTGQLVTEAHACAGCRGTANQYGTASMVDKWNHLWFDSGGVWALGRPAFLASCRLRLTGRCGPPPAQGAAAGGGGEPSEGELIRACCNELNGINRSSGSMWEAWNPLDLPARLAAALCYHSVGWLPPSRDEL